MTLIQVKLARKRAVSYLISKKPSQHGGTVKLIFLALAAVIGAQFLQGQPTIECDPTPPANGTRVFGKKCPGELCVDDCIFSLSNLAVTVRMSAHLADTHLTFLSAKLFDSNGQELDSQGILVNGFRSTNLISWKGSKAISCGTEEKLKLQIVGLEQPTNSMLTNVYLNTNTLTFKLTCVPCDNVTCTEGSGNTTVPHATEDRSVRVGALVVNLAPSQQEVVVHALSSAGWSISPESATVSLESGEGREIFFDVSLPRGLIDGPAGTITVQAQIDAIPGSQSAASMNLIVNTPLAMRLVHFDPTNAFC